MKNFLKVFFKSLFIGILVCLLFGSFITTQEIAKNQYAIMTYVDYLNEVNAHHNMLLEQQIQEESHRLKKVVKETKEVKPTYEDLKSVTVRIHHYMSEEKKDHWTGTGSIVKVTEDFTYVLTNRHVAPKDSKFLYIFKNDKEYKAEVLKVGITRDLSLIRMNGKIPNTNVIKGLRKVKEQDKVYSVGMYLGFQDIYTEGTCAGWWGKDAQSRLMNLPCLNGCSGSGVFDKDGYLVAVIYAGTIYNQFGGFDTAKAISVPYIAIYTFLEEIL